MLLITDLFLLEDDLSKRGGKRIPLSDIEMHKYDSKAVVVVDADQAKNLERYFKYDIKIATPSFQEEWLKPQYRNFIKIDFYRNLQKAWKNLDVNSSTILGTVLPTFQRINDYKMCFDYNPARDNILDMFKRELAVVSKKNIPFSVRNIEMFTSALSREAANLTQFQGKHTSPYFPFETDERALHCVEVSEKTLKKERDKSKEILEDRKSVV